MTILFAIIALACFAILIVVLVSNKKLEQKVAAEKQETERLRQYFESEKTRIFSESQASLAEAQRSLDQQSEDLKQEAEVTRQHYEAEARKSHEVAEALLAQTIKDLEPLRKYEHLGDAEAAAQRQLAEAMEEAAALRTEAHSLLEASRSAAANERASAPLRARDIHEQADARLNQAIRDAGRIIAQAEKRAQEIGGEAYAALRDTQMLEQAAAAMRNIIEGYGDRYLVPTHSLLDDLAAAYGYDAAGQSLASAREQSKRMVEQGEAAACDYVEANRRNTAIQFVIHAFNGSVDATLSRVKADNYGILEQRIKDCYSIVNRDGSAFRNARILPAYLDARLAELKWAVVTQELAQRDREEQRFLREQERDRAKAEEERLRKLVQAEKEKDIMSAAVEEAERRFAAASAEQKAEFKKQVLELRQQLEDATRRELTIAQQTVKGRVYIISNVGSFGDGVFKIGLTRRAAEERVDELSSASVPFEFDIHGVIETDNAPLLEYKLHQQFLGARINKVNLRKEFFRLNFSQIRQGVEKLELGRDFSGTVTWTEKAKAQQYYDSLDIDQNLEKKDKWIKRASLLAERRQRTPLLASNTEAPQHPGTGEEE